MAQNGPKIAQNDPEWHKMAQNGHLCPRRPKMAIYPEMAQNGPEWLKMVQMAQNGLKGPNVTGGTRDERTARMTHSAPRKA